MSLEQDTATAEVFDFNAFEDTPTGELRIKTPAGAPTPWVMTLAGPEHPDRKNRLWARQRRARAVVSKTGKLPVNDPRDDEAEKVDELAACTLGWKGAAVPFSGDAARALYADPKRQWVRVQVEAALEEREAFTRSSAAI